MALNRLNREIEDAERDGNCAFNAFVLALCDDYVLYLIERSLYGKQQSPDEYLHQFIQAVAKAYQLEPRWQVVKQRLIDLKKNNKRDLQKTLAPIMRQLCMDIAEDPERYLYYQHILYNYFLGAFDYYSKGQHDDIFSRHAFIINKFYEVLHATDDETQRYKMLDQWWWKEGYQTFLQAMRRDGVWAGDLELARLGEYFNVILHIIYNDEDYGLHGNYGNLPLLQQDIFKNDVDDIYLCLYGRGIINRELVEVNRVLSHPFSVTSQNQLDSRLARIPEYHIVLAFVEENFSTLKGLSVPSTWPQKCLNELIQRNVIVRGQDGKSYIFSQDAGTALLEIDEVPCYQQVLKLCREHYQEHACLVLRKTDEYGGHWQNTKLILDASERFHQRVTLAMQGNAAPHLFWQQPIFLRRSNEDLIKKLT